MSHPSNPDRLAQRCSAAVMAAFEDYLRRFNVITHRARERFEQRDWLGQQRDAAERLALYGQAVDNLVRESLTILDASARDKALWNNMKAAFAREIAGRVDRELAETFFNSLTRRIFVTVGVDPSIEFISLQSYRPSAAARSVYTSYSCCGSLLESIKNLLRRCSYAGLFEDLERDAQNVATAIAEERRAMGLKQPIEAIEVISSVFYRSKGAYLVGRIVSADGTMPLTLALHHDPQGIYVDAALFTADEVSIIFSFTYSYFHVEVDRPGDLVAFLQSIMPTKRTAELYNAIGYNKHGKTELYRDLIRHIKQSTDRFEFARGDRGMVMIVFTLPSYDVVFKIIRDRFAYPKTTSRREVMDRYQLVFQHDRAGRLIDVQEFEHLAFPRERFAEDLLSELAREASQSVTVGDSIVDIKHLYTERRVTPLNLYLQDANPSRARNAVLDYGQAVKDLAATNIFPGDMLLKNFGVTRHGRVVFYDYDELCLLTECCFRDLPPASGLDEEMSSEPWFFVGPRDIFPEEFLSFLGLSGELREGFLQAHSGLLTADYWRKIQARHRAGEVLDIIPYHPRRRLGFRQSADKSSGNYPERG